MTKRQLAELNALADLKSSLADEGAGDHARDCIQGVMNAKTLDEAIEYLNDAAGWAHALHWTLEKLLVEAHKAKG